MKRRDFLKLAGAMSLAGCAGTASSKGASSSSAGLRRRTLPSTSAVDPSIEVVMVERENVFTSCPISNLVLGGYRSMDDIRRATTPAHAWRADRERRSYGCRRREKSGAAAARGDLTYDRLMCRGGGFPLREVEGYADAMNSGAFSTPGKPARRP